MLDTRAMAITLFSFKESKTNLKRLQDFVTTHLIKAVVHYVH